MDNIVDFKKFKTDKEVERFEELTKEYEYIDEDSSDFATNVAIELGASLLEMGYDPRENPECIVDIFAIIEGIRGLMFRIRGIDYPFTEISDSMFKPIFEQEGKSYSETLELFLHEIYN